MIRQERPDHRKLKTVAVHPAELRGQLQPHDCSVQSSVAILVSLVHVAMMPAARAHLVADQAGLNERGGVLVVPVPASG